MNDLVETFYVTAGLSKYHVHLKTLFDRAGNVFSVGFRLAKKRHPCVNVTVMGDTLHLNGVEYSDKCTVGGNMIRRTGTQHMVKTSLRFLLDRFPGVKQVTLDDMSSVECTFDDGQKRMLSLMFSYIALNGKTWYESRLGARMENPRIREMYDANKRRLQDPDFKNTVPVSALKLEMARDVLSPDARAEIARLYEAHRTVSEFVKALMEQHAERFCVVTYRWLDVFIDTVVLEHTVVSRWEIPIDRIPSVAYRIEPTDVPLSEEFDQVGGRAARTSLCLSTQGRVSARYGWTWPSTD